MKQLTGWFHVQTSVHFLIQAAEELRINPFTDNPNLTQSEVRKALKDLKAEGVEWMPFCHSADKTGKCHGHEDARL